jgi:IclR family pca regulon transcriptional regulator
MPDNRMMQGGVVSEPKALPLERDLVSGLDRGLKVIEAFDQERPQLTIAEVAQRTGLTRAAARRYLITLTHLGYVTHEDKRFALTPKILRLGQSYLHSARLPRVIQPHLYRLAYSVGDAASAGILDNDQLVCIAAVGSGRVVSSSLQPGTRVPAFWTSNGRVLLANLPQEKLESMLEKLHLDQITEHTITDLKQLKSEIIRTRNQGYCMVDQELELGLRTIAVPLKNYRGETVAAANVCVHGAHTLSKELIEDCLHTLLKVQVEVASAL